jgi:hypothetical protein
MRTFIAEKKNATATTKHLVRLIFVLFRVLVTHARTSDFHIKLDVYDIHLRMAINWIVFGVKYRFQLCFLKSGLYNYFT